MIDYDKSKIEIYMTQNAYNLFRAKCDYRLFKKLTLSNVRYSELKSVDEKQAIAHLGFRFMLEVPKNNAVAIWNFINANPEICAEVFNEESEKNITTAQKEPDAPVEVFNEESKKNITTAQKEPVAPVIEPYNTIQEVPQKKSAVEITPDAQSSVVKPAKPRTILTYDMRKKPSRYQENNNIYMTQNAYNLFRSMCNTNLLDKITFGTIKYDKTKRHIVKNGFDFMVEFPHNYSSAVWKLINSFPEISSGVYNGKVSNIIHTAPTQKISEQNVSPASQTKKESKQKHSEVDLGQTCFRFQDLTSELAGKILGIDSHNFNGIYFYNRKSQFSDDYGEIKKIIESSPFYAGRKLAAIAFVLTVPYEKSPYFVKNPTILCKDNCQDCAYDVRGTLISYNTTTKKFEKYPAGWLKLPSQGKPLSAFLGAIKSKTGYMMMSNFINNI